jgi:hypothetical protein
MGKIYQQARHPCRTVPIYRQAGESLRDLGGLRSFLEIYSEREPCEEECQPLMRETLFGEGPNPTWSFGWNGIARSVIEEEWNAAMNALFGK